VSVEGIHGTQRPRRDGCWEGFGGGRGWGEGNHAETIEDTNLSNGVYLFRIRNETDNLFNGRVIIIK